MLLDAVGQIFEFYSNDSRGQIILNLTNLLAGLEGDVTYGSTAVSFNNQASANLTYANDPTHIVAAIPVAGTSAPIVSVAVSQPKATVGTPFTVTWSSTNTTSCTGLDSMTAGAKPTTGSATITPTAGGQYTYTISCDGSGGTARQSAALVVSIPVLKTSYENQNNIGLGRVNFSNVNYLPPGGAQGFAAADFFQTGHVDIFTSNWTYDLSKSWPEVQADPTSLSDLQFWRQQPDGTLTLLLEYKHQGCIIGRKSAVADFNNDGYPDVVLGCHGYDAGIPDGHGGLYWAGEYSKLLLSDGKGDSLLAMLQQVTAL